jgi:hypothetical protein
MPVLSVEVKLSFELTPVRFFPLALILFEFVELTHETSAGNLDEVMQEFLKLWFPKEVKVKAKANAIEAGQEELRELGMAEPKCTIQ